MEFPMVDNVFSGRLLNGERLLWTGQPAKGLLLRAQDALLIPFSLLWCGIPLFGLLNGGAAGKFGPLVVVPALFVVVGLYFVFGRFLVDAWLRAATHYAVTDQRILILRQGTFGSFTAIDLALLPSLNLKERGDGRGTIRFGEQTRPWGRNGMGIWMASADSTPQFLLIGEVRRVFDLIQRTKAAGQ